MLYYNISQTQGHVAGNQGFCRKRPCAAAFSARPERTALLVSGVI